MNNNIIIAVYDINNISFFSSKKTAEIGVEPHDLEEVILFDYSGKMITADIIEKVKKKKFLGLLNITYTYPIVSISNQVEIASYKESERLSLALISFLLHHEMISDEEQANAFSVNELIENSISLASSLQLLQ